WAL
ncbi:hypothetical protein CSDY_0048, partial [Streptococcus dysgalactiae]